MSGKLCVFAEVLNHFRPLLPLYTLLPVGFYQQNMQNIPLKRCLIWEDSRIPLKITIQRIYLLVEMKWLVPV